MKKIIAIVLASILLFVGCSNSNGNQNSGDNGTQKYASNVLKVYNTGEYIGENVIKNFEDKFNVKVQYEMFDSNETMYTKVQTNEVYDIIIPSDYMIEKLIQEGKLSKIDKTRIPNYDNLLDSLKNPVYDPNNEHSVPYFWGTVGIIYNSKNVSTELVEKEGFNIFKNTKYKDKIYMYDSERDAFMVAFKALGYSMNTDKEDEINAAYQWLKEMNDTMSPAYVTDEVIDGMVNGLKDIALVYSGDAAYILSENEDMRFFNPNEGTNIWTDAMVIPSNSPNPQLAYEFINYILSDEISLENTQFVGYASSNKNAFEEVSSEGGDYYENEAYIPRSGYKKDEVFRHNDFLKQKLSELWIKVKAQ